MFAKVFSQIYDSSIADDWQVRLVFEDFLTLSDVDGVVDMTPDAISRRTNVPLEIVLRAISVLEGPDPRSRRKDNEGRRIVRLDEHREWGWLIVNYQYYRDIASEQQRREKTRNRVKAYRSKHSDVTLGNAVKRSVTKRNDSPSASASSSGERVQGEGDPDPSDPSDPLWSELVAIRPPVRIAVEDFLEMKRSYPKANWSDCIRTLAKMAANGEIRANPKALFRKLASDSDIRGGQAENHGPRELTLEEAFEQSRKTLQAIKEDRGGPLTSPGR